MCKVNAIFVTWSPRSSTVRSRPWCPGKAIWTISTFNPNLCAFGGDQIALCNNLYVYVSSFRPVQRFYTTETVCISLSKCETIVTQLVFFSMQNWEFEMDLEILHEWRHKGLAIWGSIMISLVHVDIPCHHIYQNVIACSDMMIQI